MKRLMIITLLAISAINLSAQYRDVMRVLPDEYKSYIIRDTVPDPTSFNKDGWYYSVAGIASTSSGYVATYRKSDFHTATYTDIMVAYSRDGVHWSGHHSIAHADVWNQKSVWIAPQLSRLKNGKLVIICDLGHRNSQNNWPMLTEWQKPNRGMYNYLFWSEDEGKTWSGPQKIDDVGGEPGYITELKNGDLIYTRTRSGKTDKLWNPPAPWYDMYYLNESVRSTDGGKTWEPPVILGDNPYFGDCEVGTVELSPNKLLAITRVGMGGGAFKQPSRFIYSGDGGKSWGNPKLAPIYAQRPIVRKLQSGKLLAVYRNRWGTPGTYAFLFDEDEEFDYQPATFVYDESTCQMKDGVMEINTKDGLINTFVLGFYPAQSPKSTVEITATIKVNEAEENGCVIGAGCFVSITPDRVFLTEKPEIGFKIDAKQWHNYKFVRKNDKLKISVDGKLKLDVDVKDLLTRHVQVGNRHIKSFDFENVEMGQDNFWKTESKSYWKSLSVMVDNHEDVDINWSWNPENGFPDQFRRDRIIALEIIADHFAHTGYPSITQSDDGTIIIADYTVGGNGGKTAPMPFIRAYKVSEELLENLK
ncbi:MAG: glycoside hydrolase [Cytophagales bacterium]|nr:glycoside hydrolase [Cytophagales bacterium]